MGHRRFVTHFGRRRIPDRNLAVCLGTTDLRFTHKFKPNVGTAVTSYNIVASPLTLAMYATPASPIPIIRNEDLHLYGAQIRLGLNDLAGAVSEINNVRTMVGHIAPVANPGTYTGVRDLVYRIVDGGAIGQSGRRDSGLWVARGDGYHVGQRGEPGAGYARDRAAVPDR